MELESGIHVISADAVGPILQEAEARRFRVISLALDGIASKDAMLERLRQALELPDYMGASWDALEECLRDMSAEDKQGFLILVEPGGVLMSFVDEDFRTLLSILKSTADFWASDGIPFIVMFRGGSPALIEVVEGIQQRLS